MGKHIDWNLYTDMDDLLVNLEFYKKNIKPDPHSDCHLWTGATHRQGYGMVGGIRKKDMKRVMTVAHRIAARLKWGRALGKKEFVIHTCSNVKCQNPDHLILGDYHKKSEIMWANGRGPKNMGTAKVRGVLVKQDRDYKYTEDEIKWIRDANTIDIAKKYKVTRARAGHLRWSMRVGFKWLPWEKKQ